MVSGLFCFLCFTSSVSLTSSYTEDEPKFLTNNKQLLDEVFVISRIIKVKVGVIGRSRRLRLITLTETLTILDITKTESNNCPIRLLYIQRKKKWSRQWVEMIIYLSTCKHTNRELGMITPKNHALRSYMIWLPMTLTWLLYNLQVLTSRALISKSHCRLLANQKRVRELNVW